MTPEEPKILTTTANDFPAHRIVEHLGIVRGITVRSPNIAQGFLGGLKMIIGGRNQAYINVCEKAREEALRLLIEHALEKGANAIIAIRYDATEFAPNVTEVLAYGTAVIAQPQ